MGNGLERGTCDSHGVSAEQNKSFKNQIRDRIRNANLFDLNHLLAFQMKNEIFIKLSEEKALNNNNRVSE